MEDDKTKNEWGVSTPHTCTFTNHCTFQRQRVRGIEETPMLPYSNPSVCAALKTSHWICACFSDSHCSIKMRKVAIVTGGAGGIGRGITQVLLQQAPKVEWNVHVVDFSRATIEDAKTFFKDYVDAGRVSFQEGDCGDHLVAKAAVDNALKTFGHLNLLVNNAGGGGFVPFLEQTPEGWMKVINSNLSSCFYFSQAATPALTETYGSIINISSTRAFQSEPNTEAYSASKGGICGLTHAMAASLAHKVKVNCVCPGWIDVSGPKWGPGRTQLEIKDSDRSQHHSNRIGTPRDIAEAILYLEGAGFVSGQTITIDGGMSVKMIYEE